MQYAVHLYPTVRVTVTGIEADSVAEAASKAEVAVNLRHVLNNPRPRASNVESVEWDEGANNFILVDPLDENGDVIYGESESFDGFGNPLVEGKTLIERKAKAADELALFMKELLDSVETLTDIAESHGARTLSDLIYLQAAILTGEFIDHYPDESAVLEIVRSLPSGEKWAKFIRTEDAEQPQTDRP